MSQFELYSLINIKAHIAAKNNGQELYTQAKNTPLFKKI